MRAFSRASLFAAALCLCFGPTSCGPKVTKGDVLERIQKDLQIGSTRQQVAAFIDPLEINGIKATQGNYITPSERNGDPRVKGFVGSCLCDKRSGLVDSDCVCMMFYFDESEKLVTYEVDEFDKK
jgi:hypothetical protein